MSFSKEDLSGNSQLKGLLDLLIDLQVVNQESSEASLPSNGNGQSQVEEGKRQEAEGTRFLSDGDSTPTAREQPIEDGVSDPCSLRSRLQDEGIIRASCPLPSTFSDEPGDPQAVEECQDSSTKAVPVLETESSDRIPQLHNEDVGMQGRANTPKQDAQAQGHGDAGKPSTILSPSTNPTPPLLGASPPVNLKQTENVETTSKQDFSRLIQSQWQNVRSKEPTSQSSAFSDDKQIENSIAIFERWQRLILTQEVMDAREAIANFKKQLANLEHQIYEPKELISLLLPLITEILSLKVAKSGEDVAQAIAPVLDEMIRLKVQQDQVAMGSALAPVLPEAIAQQVSNSPGDLAKAFGPEMGTAIKEQINLERDAMVDALYPVIGSTISKYMAEAIKAINEKVENTFSVEGVSRKIRAKMQGVSEAELILKEAMPFTVQAIFLIHKGSGLIISDVQPSDRQHLESEMVAGMLTAIRSFANDCMAQPGQVSEIDQIDYGNFQITLEVAGYCYLAVVTQGRPPKPFIQKMRGALVTIVQKHGKAIESFDGDPDNVPEQVHEVLQDLIKVSQTATEEQKRKPPITLLVLSLIVLSTLSLSIGIYQYQTGVNRRIEAETSLALASDPELAVYRLAVNANRGTIKLSGKLPNQYLRSKAEQIARKVEPKLKINNAIIPVEVPPDPVLTQAEVKRATNILNQMDGAVISAEYRQGQVLVEGAVLQEADARKITQVFLQIPGVKSVSNTVQLQPLAIASRVYFDQGSSELKSSELSKINPIKAFLEQYPDKHLKLVGHTDPKGTAQENEPLALERAKKVRDVLIAQGIDSKRMQIEGTTKFPLGVDGEQIPLLSRCVQFEIITP